MPSLLDLPEPDRTRLIRSLGYSTIAEFKAISEEALTAAKFDQLNPERNSQKIDYDGLQSSYKTLNKRTF